MPLSRGYGSVITRGVNGMKRSGRKQRLEHAHGNKFGESSIAMPFARNRGRAVPFTLHTRSFRASTATSSDWNNKNISQSPCDSEGGSDVVCQLFREIGDRIELAGRERKPTPNPRGDRASTTTQRKSAARLTSEFCESYLSLPDKHPSSLENDPKLEFIHLLLSEQYDVNEESIESTIENVQSRSLRTSDILRIRELCTPQYERIFHNILGSAQQDLGVAFLVKLRRDLRDVIRYWKFVEKNEKQDGEGKQQSKDMIGSSHLTKLQTVERNIHTIITSLFRLGVLNLQRITYQDTPASIIEQIAFREAVHPLRSLQDLRTRLGPGRRCFAFFHPALPNKPLVFVHVALLQEIPTSMDDLQHATESNATCATFYSITNTEQGLAGVDLGNHLIKSVVQVLQNEFPKLTSFCTLSPIPKFRKWLEGKIVRYHEGLLRKRQSKKNGDDNSSDFSLRFMDSGLFCTTELQQLQDIFSSESYLLDLLETLKSPTWHTSSSTTLTNSDECRASTLVEKLQPVLLKLAAYYLTIETHHGRPLCPVAKFHIGNGAEMYRLNYMADTSSKGMRNSCGMMMNYCYLLDEIEENRVRYEISGGVVARDGVTCWLT